MELCNRMDKEDFPSCTQGLAWIPQGLNKCTVCAERHARLVGCVKKFLNQPKELKK